MVKYNDYEKARLQTVECVNSLQSAITAAGGNIIDTQRMLDMSLMEFITTIAAQNNIHFYYKQPGNKTPPVLWKTTGSQSQN